MYKSAKISGFSLIEFIVYVALTAAILLLVQNSVGYFKHKIIHRMAKIGESTYMQRGFFLIDSITTNASIQSVSTTTHNFSILLETHLDGRVFSGNSQAERTKVLIECNAMDRELILHFVSRNKEVTLFTHPYIQIELCVFDSRKFIIKTAYNTYSHSLINFSQFFPK